MNLQKFLAFLGALLPTLYDLFTDTGGDPKEAERLIVQSRAARMAKDRAKVDSEIDKLPK